MKLNIGGEQKKEGWKISENLAQNIFIEKQKQELIKRDMSCIS